MVLNSFEIKFFEKYIPEGHTIKNIVHQHWIKIVDNLFLSLSMAVLIPTIIYYYSGRIQELIPFFIFESYLIVIFIKIIYDIFDWYNDVWIITDKALIDLDWALFKTNMKTVDYDNIEWIEVEQNSIWDKILRKWDLIVHKIWDDIFMLKDANKAYKSLNYIETVREEVIAEQEETEDKFDMVMDTLSWVVKEYLWKNWLPKKESEIQNLKDDLIENVESKNGTIDLR